MLLQWDEQKRRRVIKRRQIDIVYAALIVEEPVLTVVDHREDYGEIREVSIGVVDGERFVVVHTNGRERSASSPHGREVVTNMTDMNKASLDEIRRMKDRGDLHHDPEAPAGGEFLSPEFWANARLEPARSPRSVHLRLNPDVFEFFKNMGKGHLTKMQDVLKAYVRAHSSG